ncbi:MAG: DUF2062 domain-containing protein [Leptolyngbyaceae cyanobacterium SM2_5_2]|nr:DUF2062 domain-containing protein [Leptolyngbyaceae cyanobacterium SM2_5_2]
MTSTVDPHTSPKPATRISSQPAWRRKLRYFYLRFVRLQGSPEYLARGMASGIFSGSFPLFGLQIIIGVTLATIVRGNRIMAAAATWVSNPFTYLPIFAFNYQVGQWLLGGEPTQGFTDLDSLKGWMDMGTDVSVKLMLGSTVVGAVASVASYYFGLPIIRRLREHRSSKIRTNKN